MPAGRPSIYNLEIAENICEQIATSSKSMKTICKELNMSVLTVICWITESHPNFIAEFAKMYARAKDMQVEYLAEEILSISDDSSTDTDKRYTASGEPYDVENKEWVNRSRLRVDARKWIASKLKPKKYGERVEHSGNINLTNEPIKFE